MGSSAANSTDGTAIALVVRRVTLDELSVVRHIHSSAFRTAAASCYPEEEIAAFLNHVYTQDYSDALLNEHLLGGFLGSEMIATAGWLPADDSDSLARIKSLYVRPLFTGIGIGRRMAFEAEDAARHSGFTSFGARVPLHATGFFETLGYEVTSYGVQLLGSDRGLPVSFMRKSDLSKAEALDADADEPADQHG